MKKLFFVSLCLLAGVLSAQVKPISQDMIDYSVGSDISWQTNNGKLCNSASGKYVIATPVVMPYSKDCAIEILVKPLVKRGAMPAASGIILASPDRKIIWELLLTDNKPHDRRVSVRLVSNIRGVNQKKAQVKCLEGKGFRWDYNKEYLMRIERTGKTVTFTVRHDGKTVSRQTAVENSDEPLTGGVMGGNILAEFSEFKAKYSAPVEVKQTPLKPLKPKYVPYSNVSKKFKAKATGFFYTKQDSNGKWWLIDPAGNGFFACGADCVNWNGRSCEKLGYSEFHRNVRAKFENEKEWMYDTKKRLDSWGFNFAGTCSKVFRDQIPWATNLMIGSNFAAMGDNYNICPYEGRVGTALPNPFHPRFSEFAAKRYMAYAGRHIHNPYFLGYYCDNELRWGGINNGGAADGTGLFDTVMQKNSDHTAKTALVNQLKEIYKGDIKSFNKEWNTQLSSFDGLLNIKALPHTTEKQTSVKKEFLKLTAETYFKIIRDSIKSIDPNHLFLGCRYAGPGAHEIIWKANAKYSDIVSFNIYPIWDRNRNQLYDNSATPMNELFDKIYKMCNRPIMVTEWAFQGLDVGLPCTYGAGQRFLTQKDRAQAAGLFYKTMLGHKAMVGCSWYEFSDDPALGVRTRHPENSNYGLVNKFNEPYSELVNTFAEINKDIDTSRQYVSQTLPENKSGKLYAEFDKPGPGNKNVKVQVTGNGFEASNGTIRVKTLKGGKTEVYFRDKLMGHINYIVNTQNKVRTWSGAVNCRDIKVTDLQNGTEIRFTGDSSSVNGTQSTTVRLFIPAKGAYMIADLVSIKNTGTTELFVKGFYFVVKPDINNLPPDPNLGRASQSSWDIGAWVTKEAEFIAVANSLGKFNVLFFRHPKEGDKADCVRGMDAKVKPQETYYPTSPAYLFIYTGNGAFEARGKKLIKADIE